MMPDEKELQTKAIDSISQLSINDRLEWIKKSNDSYSSKVGSVKFDIDKSAAGDEVTYVLWLFEGANLSSRVDGRYLKGSPTDGRFASYQEVLKSIFTNAQKHVKNSSLERVLNELEEFRTSNVSPDDD